MKFFKRLMIFYDSWNAWHRLIPNSIHLFAYCSMPSLSQLYFLSLQPMTACLSLPSSVFRATVLPGRAVQAALQVWGTERSFKGRSNFCPEQHIAAIITTTTVKKALRDLPSSGEEEVRADCATKVLMLLNRGSKAGLAAASCEMMLSGSYRPKISSRK